MMRHATLWVLILVWVGCTCIFSAQTIEEYILKANTYHQAGNLKRATAVMEEAIQKLPDEPLAYSYCGFFCGLLAGNTKDFDEAANLVTQAFSHLDKAVSLNRELPLPRYHRGVLAIKVPEFLGKLDQGIHDLELLLKLAKQDQKAVRKETIYSTVLVLTEGYDRKRSWDKAIDLLEQFLTIAPSGQWQTTAASLLKKIKAKKEKQDPDSKLICDAFMPIRLVPAAGGNVYWNGWTWVKTASAEVNHWGFRVGVEGDDVHPLFHINYLNG